MSGGRRRKVCEVVNFRGGSGGIGGTGVLEAAGGGCRAFGAAGGGGCRKFTAAGGGCWGFGAAGGGCWAFEMAGCCGCWWLVGAKPVGGVLISSIACLVTCPMKSLIYITKMGSCQYDQKLENT